ncbi:MAG: hypothetical protein ACPLZA_00845 [Thermodesulfovibrio sp.]|jgi:hypothetical protein|uniref:Uncharacterized protein n=2 Tax=Thermodesulfovibrio TaxID=28261 RepID=A0A2J6WPF4_9BACT|nr:MAG: hypothetical protein C0186_01710 [Thermodesulfovibrio aggregans]
MNPEDKIDPLGPYSAIRSVKEGSVFAKYKLRKKFKKKEEQPEGKTTPRESSEHKIDIEA